MTRLVSEGNTGTEARTVATGFDSFAGSEVERRDKASGPILGALKKAEDEFREWDASCHLIDDIYSKHGGSYERLADAYGGASWRDSELDLFWASYEILKPAVYARPPRPAVKPLFSDAHKLKTLTAEVLERATTSAFARTGIDDVMTEVRDDLIFTGRGVPWMRYESDDGQKVCAEHLDRTDFLHEPARKWSQVGWVAARFWLDRDEVKDRFKSLTEEKLDALPWRVRQNRHDNDIEGSTAKIGVWEVWHRADNKVYWVTDGLDVQLDADEPHLKLSGFFPCPRPAYATLRRRSLVPVPDWERYAGHFSKINTLTGRIYLLLEQVKMKGLIPAGGDIGDAIEKAMGSDDDQILIPVPGAALLASGGANGFVVWMPLAEVATAIQGLITARGQLIEDFYQLSGISDIMRGATEAEETLGAQQLKSQYGSVRVRGKIDELQRVAADMVKIAAEIIADKFTKETILEMAQMELPTKAELSKRVKEIEDFAEKELKGLSKRAEEAAERAMQSGEQVDPAQATQMLQQAQQEVLSKYAPMLEEVQNLVPVDDVMKLLRDDKARSFAFEVESDSTILTDENAEKQSRNEFMGAFTQATQSLVQIASMGEAGGKLAGELMKFTLAPYRAGRQLDSAIDAFIDAAPAMAAAMQGGGDAEGMGALAEAEKMKAQAQMERVNAQREADQGRNALAQAEMQRKMGQMQQDAARDQQKAGEAMEKLRQSAEDSAAKLAKTEAEIDHIRAQTAEILNSIGLDERKQQLEEYRTAENSQDKQIDRVVQAEDKAVDRQFREAETFTQKEAQDG
jgi:hypothetical protein